MNVPRLGVSLPHFGPYAGAEAVATIARAADQLGYHAVSVSERLLMPVSPEAELKDGLPQWHVWDPIEVLTWAAAHTSRVRLTTGIVNAIFQPPLVLARRLATLDRLSGGRLVAGIGQGGGGAEAALWGMPEEFVATGVPFARRGNGFVEHVAAMRACWAPDPVEFDGEYYRIPRAAVGPKPYGETIPLLFGAMTRTTVERAARLADGFVGVALDWAETRTKVQWYRDAGGEGPVILNTLQSYPAGTPPTAKAFIDAIRADLDRAASVGADEMHFTLNLVPVDPSHQVDLLTALATELDLRLDEPEGDE